MGTTCRKRDPRGQVPRCPKMQPPHTGTGQAFLKHLEGGVGQMNRSVLHLAGGRTISRELVTLSVSDTNWILWGPETFRDRNP